MHGESNIKFTLLYVTKDRNPENETDRQTLLFAQLVFTLKASHETDFEKSPKLIV
jgi:hypothetical protein